MLGLRSEREVRGSKIRDGEGQGWAGGMVRRNLGRERKVFRDADARCTASTAAPAAERETGAEREERNREKTCYNDTETAPAIHSLKQYNHTHSTDFPRFIFGCCFFFNVSGESNKY